jgi:signal transduction histidine kinase
MKRRSLILMILIVLLPVGLLTWLGMRIARDEQSVTEQRFRSLMQQRLDDVNRVITSRFSETERRLQQITAVDNFELSALRELVRTEPQVTQLFVLSPDGSLMYPNPGDALNGTELSFLQRAARMFTDRDLQNAVAQAEAGARGDFSPLVAEQSRSGGMNDEQAVNDAALAFQEQKQTESISESLAMNSEVGAQVAKNDRPDLSRSPDGASKSRFLPPNSRRQADVDGVEEQRAASRAKAPANSKPDDPFMRAADVDPYDALPMGAPGTPPADAPSAFDNQMPQVAASAMSGEFPSANGWFVWYWDRGLNLVYWQRRPSGHIVGAALERARWIADLISWLPETDTSRSYDEDVTKVDTSFRVVSSSAEVVYEWGKDLAKNAVPFCETSLPAPLASWRLQCFLPPGQIAAGAGRSAFLGFSAGLAAFAITLTALAWLLYRDYARDMREASQQVSFVNQVSHELKTPLTNIRLYAELLERDLEQVSPEQAEKPVRRLEIISSEAQRLSRLIGNVLTFAGQQRKTLQMQPSAVQVSELVRHIAERFEPSLNSHGIRVTVESNGSNTLSLDADFVEQILGNLISNVEKYAAVGKQLTIRTATSPADVVLDVIDAGPGIPQGQQTQVFQPFARLSDDLRASTGTGIGLSITRDLARLHGGDAVLMKSEIGCWFQVRLKSMPDIRGGQANPVSSS